MLTTSPAVQAEGATKIMASPRPAAGGLLAAMRAGLLKWVRGLAWRVLDLETEFEALD